jgi:hypothetical protein
MKMSEIIQKLREYYRTGHGPSWNPNTKECRYWTEDGNACAIGCLIPPEHAETLDKAYHSVCVAEIVKAEVGLPGCEEAILSVRRLLPDDLSLLEAKDFLGRLQRMHDHFADEDKFSQLVLNELSFIENEYAGKLLSRFEKA